MQKIDPYWAATLRFKMISRITLATMLAAGLVLLAALLFFKNEQGFDYLGLVQSYTVTAKNLDAMLIIAGLFLLFCVGAASWVLTLYASFRIAGPLFRIARNLESASNSRDLPGIRKRDCLQDVSQQLQTAVNMLHDHYACIGSMLDHLEQELLKEAKDKDAIKSYINALKNDVHRVRLG
ncbi:MAG: hypothetical protein L3J26_03565 [Candidatus Polarisedimenticolaceae bacterium]|nr:hypothetical protein [Candidatus Polarisedimenticolaceae bacterium]